MSDSSVSDLLSARRADLSAVTAALTGRRPVSPCRWQAQDAFVKKAMPPRWRDRCFPLYAPWLRRKLAPGVPFVPRVYPAGLPVEAVRLAALHAAGCRVPEILAVDRDAFVMSDAGWTLEDELNPRDDPAACLRWLTLAVTDLTDFHAAGHWHGGAQARNLTLGPEGRLGRIDFETDYDRYLPLSLLQGFDVLLFLSSVTRYVSDDDFDTLSTLCVSRSGAAVRAVLSRALPLVGWLARSSLLARTAPKEARRVRAIARTLAACRADIGHD